MPPARMNNVCETNGPRKWKNIFGRPDGMISINLYFPLFGK